MTAIMTSRQAAELDHAMERNGWTAEDAKWLSEGNRLKEILRIRHGTYEVQPARHIVDFGAPPRLPFNNAKMFKHISEINGKEIVEIELRPDDNLYVDNMRVILHLSKRQMSNKTVTGHELRQELENDELVLLNSNVLDYLYDHPELFPEHWKKDENGKIRIIFFWGSIFRNPSDGRLHVRYLCWNGGSLHRDYIWLDCDWNRQDPSVSLASN